MTRSTRDLPKGILLLDALLREVEPEVRRRLEAYGDHAAELMFFLPGDEPPDDQGWWYFRQRFERLFEGKLIFGDLVGTGVYLPADPHRPRRIIPAELWKRVFVNYEKSTITWGSNRNIVDVEVLTTAELVDWERARHSSTPKISDQSRGAPDKTITFHDGVLKIDEETMLFRGEKQQRLVEHLVETYRQKKPRTTKDLLEAAGFSISIETLPKAFGKNRDWERLKRYIQRPNGYVILVEDPSDP